MTEREWLGCEDHNRIMAFLQANDASPRRLRLLACAGCRAVWLWMNDERSREAVAVAEEFADGGATAEELKAAASRAHEVTVLFRYGSPNDFDISVRAFYATDYPVLAASHILSRCQARLRHKLLREIFGNPFWPVAFDPSWRTSDVMLLAKGIYAEKAFDRMPILADALQDAGCESDELLAHLRDTNASHVRGCWALDLVLGKA